MAIGFARAGAAVTLVSRTESQLQKVAAEIEEQGGRALVCAADVTDPKAVNECIEATTQSFGSIDILVNNAGDNILGSIQEMDPDVWWRQIEVNLRGPYLFSRAVLPAMLEKNWGRIINISSVNGKRGAKFCTAYCTGKHGIIGLTRALALDVAKSGITVNAICPGWIKTDLTDRTFAQRSELFNVPVEKISQVATMNMPQGRPIEEDEITPTALFLASDGAARMTGQSLNVSGGAVMW